MRAAFGVEFHVSASFGIYAFQAGLDLPGRSRRQLDLLKQEEEMPIPVPPARRHDLRHAAFQARTCW